MKLSINYLVLLAAASLSNGKDIPSLQDFDSSLSQLKEDTNAIDKKKQQISEKLDAVHDLKEKLVLLENEILKEKRDMTKEQEDIGVEEEKLEKKLNTINFMTEKKVQSGSDLLATYKSELSDLKMELEKVEAKRVDVENKTEMVNFLKNNNVNSIDELENLVSKGAEKIVSQQLELKDKWDELSDSLERGAKMNLRQRK